MSVRSRVAKLKEKKKEEDASQARLDKEAERAAARCRMRLEVLVERILGECEDKRKGIKREGEHNLVKKGQCILRLKVCLTEHESFTGDDSRGSTYYAWEVLMWTSRSEAHNDQYGTRLGDKESFIEEQVAEEMAKYL